MVFQLRTTFTGQQNRRPMPQQGGLGQPDVPEALLQPTQPGDPDFAESSYRTQAQFPAAAAQMDLIQNRRRAARLIEELRVTAPDEITPELETMRATGLEKEEPSFFMRVLSMLDAPRRTVNLFMQDMAGGTAGVGFENPGIGDYMGTLFGFKDNDEVLEATGLEPESGSMTLSMLGIKEASAENTWGRIGRFALHAALEIMTDPLTYVTFGASAVGKKVLGEVAKGLVDDTMRNIGEGVAKNALEGRMLKRVDELEKLFGTAEGATKFKPLTTVGSASNRQRALIKAREELADEVLRPIITRDFGKLTDDVIDQVDAFASGGARLYMPLSGWLTKSEIGGRKTLAGIQKGITIPGTRGAGRKINETIGDVFEFIAGDRFARTNFGQAVIDYKKTWRRSTDAWSNLHDGLKAGRLSGSEYYYIVDAANARVFDNKVAEAIALTNNQAAKVIGAALEAAPDMERARINQVVWSLIADPNKKEIYDDLAQHGHKVLADAAREYAGFVREQWDILREGLVKLDPRVAEALQGSWMPEVLSKGGRKVLQKIAESGSDVQTYLLNAVEANDPGAYFLAALIAKQGDGAVIPGNMTSHTSLLGLGKAGKDKVGTVPMINLVDGASLADEDLGGRVMLMDIDKLSDVPWIAELQKILGATEEVSISAPKLNDLIENHLIALAERMNIPLPKDTGSRLFLEDPFEAVIEVTQHLHQSGRQLNLIKQMKEINGIKEVDTFEAVPGTIQNIKAGINEKDMSRALTKAIADAEKGRYKSVRARVRTKYKDWKTRPRRNLSQPKTRERWGVEESQKGRGIHGFVYDTVNDKYYWATRADSFHQPAYVRMFKDWVESGQIDDLIDEGMTGNVDQFLASASKGANDRQKLVQHLIDYRTGVVGEELDFGKMAAAFEDYMKQKNAGVVFPKLKYGDEADMEFYHMLKEIQDADPEDMVGIFNEYIYHHSPFGGEVSPDDVRRSLRSVAHDSGYKHDLQDIMEQYDDLTSGGGRFTEFEHAELMNEIRNVFEEALTDDGLVIRGSFYGTAEYPWEMAEQVGSRQELFKWSEELPNAIHADAGYRQLKARDPDAAERFARELEEMALAKDPEINVVLGLDNTQPDYIRKPGLKAEGTPGDYNARRSAGREVDAMINDLAKEPPGPLRDVKWKTLEQIVGKEDLHELVQITKDIDEINQHAEELVEIFGRLFGAGPARVRDAGKLDFGSNLVVTPSLKGDLEKAQEYAREMGLPDKVINAFAPEQMLLPPAEGFVNPKIFGVIEKELSGTQVKVDIARFFEQTVKNMSAVYTPQGIAQAKESAAYALRVWKTATTITRPTFHMRNVLGGVWNNQIVGVRLRDYAAVNTAAMRVRSKLRRGATLHDALESISDPRQRQMMWAAWDSGMMDQSFSRTEFRHLTTAERRTVAQKLSYVNPADPEGFVLAKGGAFIMESMEDFMRLAAFNRWYDPALSNGANIAREMSLAVHFDYSQLTEFETKIKHLVPFYVWFRRNIPLQMKTMLEQPGLVNRYTHVMNAFDENFGGQGEYDEFAVPEWWNAQAAGTDILLHEGTPFWARAFFDPDIPLTDLTHLDPLDPTSIFKQLADLLGPHMTLPFDLATQSEWNDVNAPTGLNEIMQQLNAGGFFNQSADGDIQIPYLARTLWNTAFPWYNEVVETGLGPSDPRQAAKVGDAPGDENLARRLGLRLARGVGLQWQTPQDTRSPAFQTNERLNEIMRDLKQRNAIPMPEDVIRQDDPRYLGLFSGGG